mmetsp:Transcript_30562/g.49460  ORF Transcript_30562/g.49460 Transcript_30562/m.49460 type:complete len:82 (+) Transcript_30562:692-937(+)
MTWLHYQQMIKYNHMDEISNMMIQTFAGYRKGTTMVRSHTTKKKTGERNSKERSRFHKRNKQKLKELGEQTKEPCLKQQSC